MTERAEIGIFGGSGLYSLAEDARPVSVETPFGPPSDDVTVATLGGRRVAFLPRHGRGHTIPPHRINYRANVWALRALGVQAILGPGAVGSLQAEIHPGDFVVCDQFVDRTHGRADTYFDGAPVTHVSAAEPYCPLLRRHLIEVCRRQGVSVHESGTLVVINGPRFSTRAESSWFTAMGWSVVGMTGYPEGWLAREMQLPYANLSLVTDYDAGIVGDAGHAVTSAAVLEVFERNTKRLRAVLLDAVATLPDLSQSPARTALVGAQLG